MRRVIGSALGVSAFAAGLVCGAVLPANADYVNGYYRKDGTYVAPYHRSSPNNTQRDNYSTYGNYNPYTGQQGTKKCGLYEACN